MKSILIATGLMLLFEQHIYAQPTERQGMTVWLNGGLGGCSIGSIAGNASLNLQTGGTLFTLRTTANSESSEMLMPGDEFYDIGLLIGFASSPYEQSRCHCSIAAGIARVSGHRSDGGGSLFGTGRDSSYSYVSPTIGIPIEAQWSIRPFSFLGFGVCVYTNINLKQSFLGATLFMQLGVLR